MTVHFPGDTTKIDVGNGPSLQLTGACTLSCWLNLDVSDQNIEFISKYIASDRGFTLQTDDDSPDTYGIFLIAKTSTAMSNSGWTASPLVPGTWYHIAGQFIPSTAVQIWQDGVLSNEKTSGVPATMYNPPNNVVLGNRSDGSQGLDGKLDDVRIYNRNLSAGEMQTLYAAEGRDGIVEGLISRWLFNEGAEGVTLSGSGSVKDVGPGGNHGTPSGTSTYIGSELSWRR